jgi:hypothetical protein
VRYFFRVLIRTQRVDFALLDPDTDPFVTGSSFRIRSSIQLQQGGLYFGGKRICPPPLSEIDIFPQKNSVSVNYSVIVFYLSTGLVFLYFSEIDNTLGEHYKP